MNTSSQPNRLIHSSSPYLLQHAYNPVDWYPWGEEALQKAKLEDKPIIVSIGYAACHWCHVMERESFENEQIAALMNAHFVCIKVDREERPDVDAIYMDAITIMGQRGGWPLNAFLTPEAKPFYAGTYFPPQNWYKLLQQIAEVFQKQREEIEQSAEGFKKSLSVSEIEKYGLLLQNTEFKKADLDQMFEKLEQDFDKEKGGIKKAPKFPMPSIYFFLLNYYALNKNEKAKEHLLFSLREIAKGGIYDQAGGGFARYSVDAEWLVPHFEKMLYDNAQLIELYAQAYRLQPDPLFKSVVYESIDFLQRELMSPEYGFYSALDADSEGEEGKFYVWEANELQSLIGEDYLLFKAYYQITEEGNWEEGKNILHCKSIGESFASTHGISNPALDSKILQWKSLLMQERAKRIRPGLDDKILTSWNAMACKALAEAYRVFGEKSFLELALQNAAFIQKQIQTDGKIFHTYKDGKSSIDGFLEDYAFCIDALIQLYQTTFEISWIREAEKLMGYVLKNFFDPEEEMFFFTDARAESLIARKKEIFDNVIPASNSMMARNLYTLGLIADQPEWISLSERMLGRVKRVLMVNVEYLSNWAVLYAQRSSPTAEVVIVGREYQTFAKQVDQLFYPNKVLLATEKERADLPLFEQRTSPEGSTRIYLCFQKTCQLPVDNVKALEKQLEGI